MATYKAELYNAESVMDFYNESQGTKFKVYAGTSCKPEYCRWSYDGTEKTAGSDILSQALVALKNNQENTNTYTLQVINRKKTGKEEPEQVQISFRLNNPAPYIPYAALSGNQGSAGDPELKAILRQMAEGQNLLISKLSEREVEEDQEEKSGIGSLLANEQFQQVAIAGITALLNGFLSKGAGMQAGPSAPFDRPTALAGIPGVKVENDVDQQTKLAVDAIRILSERDPQFGDHLLYLANLPASQYNMLLTFIK